MKQNNTKRVLWIVIASVLAIAAIAAIIVFGFTTGPVSEKLTVEEAQQYVDRAFSGLPTQNAVGSKTVINQTKITVLSVDYGNQKDMTLHCEYAAPDLSEITKGAEESLVRAYRFKTEREAKSLPTSATNIFLHLKKDFNDQIEQLDTVSGKIDLSLYETSKGKFELYLNDKAVDTCTGGLITYKNTVDSISIIDVDGEKVDIGKMGTLRNGVKDLLALNNYDTEKPDTSPFLIKKWNSFRNDFYRNFIQDAKWHYLRDGLMTTLSITVLAALLGIFIGIIVAIIRCTCQTTGKMKIADKICGLYLTIVRGTPVMVQLIIVYFVFLLPIGVAKFPSAVLCFGFNSGAYVAEIIRGGIMAVDKGQMEAGRSLGFNYASTMIHIIIPQAFKAVLPALANEFITLLKESSVAFYIGVGDLTKGGLTIRSLTFDAFLPLIAVAVIYLVIVLFLTWLVSLLERRLRKSDH